MVDFGVNLRTSSQADLTSMVGDFLAPNVPTLIDIDFSTLGLSLFLLRVDMWCSASRSPPSSARCFLLKQEAKLENCGIAKMTKGVTIALIRIVKSRPDCLYL